MSSTLGEGWGRQGPPLETELSLLPHWKEVPDMGEKGRKGGSRTVPLSKHKEVQITNSPPQFLIKPSIQGSFEKDNSQEPTA